MFTGATIATGAIANTASVSTGAFTVSAAIFMCVPRFILPGGRQTSDHSLYTEQDISTAASAVATAFTAIEYDSLSRRAQMIILMERNASNT
jgi:hypothetical protein